MDEPGGEGQCSPEMGCLGLQEGEEASRRLEGPGGVNWCWNPQGRARKAVRVRRPPAGPVPAWVSIYWH